MKIFLKQILKFRSVWMMALALTGFIIRGNAQYFGNSNQITDPFMSQYFTNPYLANPAMAGIDSGLSLNAAYRKQYTDMPGAPVSEAFSADLDAGKRVGLGLIAYNDQAGLIDRTRFALTYAYHLPLRNDGQFLSFGISAAYAHTSLNPKGIVGDQTDPAIAQFNARKNTLEVDYGMAYSDTKLSIQASLLNVIGFMEKLNNTTADVATFYGAASYKFETEGTIDYIEPLLSFEGVKNYNSIVTAGANLVMLHQLLNFSLTAGSQGNISIGTGVTYKQMLSLQLFYMTQTSEIRRYSNGNYEIALSLFLPKRE